VAGNSPIVTIDGGSGSGKTVIAKLVQKILAPGGIQVKILELDWFLKDRRWREAVQKVVAHDPASGPLVLTDQERELLGDMVGKLKSGEKYLGEEGFFDYAPAFDLLEKLREFRSSGRDREDYVVKNAYIRGDKDHPSRIEDVPLVFEKSVVYIFEGSMSIPRSSGISRTFATACMMTRTGRPCGLRTVRAGLRI